MMRDGASEVEMDIGAVEVGETETIDVGGEQVELTPVSVGNPHAVIRREPGPANCVLAAGRDASAFWSAPTSSSSAGGKAARRARCSASGTAGQTC